MDDDRPNAIDAALHSYVGRQLLAREALDNDPQYRAQLEWLRQALTAMSEAMDAEHVPTHIRDRIIHRVLYGSAPDEQAAMDRLVDRQRAYEEAASVSARIRRAPAPSTEQEIESLDQANFTGLIAHVDGAEPRRD